MGNPFGNIANLMKQAKEMQAKMKQTQEQLATEEIEGVAGAGMVSLVINGNGEALRLDIDDSVLQEDKQVLQGLILAAVNDANKKRDIRKKEAMSGFMSGMGLPDGFDFPGDDTA